MFTGIFGTKRQSVFSIKNALDADMSLVGQKGQSLLLCLKNCLPVSPGFMISTEVSKSFSMNQTTLRQSLKDDIKRHVSILEKETGRDFFCSEEYQDKHRFPLLISIRESPVIGSPGTSTVLNVGINPTKISRMREVTGRNLFVLDTYRRFLQDWGINFLGIDEKVYQDIVDEKLQQLQLRSAHSNHSSTLRLNQLSYDELELITNKFEVITPYPTDPLEQLYQVVTKIFQDYDSLQARAFRATHGIPSEGCAVVLQSMWFGNLTTLSSGTGSCYSRDPSSGENVLTGFFRSRTEGHEDVFHGTRDMTMPQLCSMCPNVYQNLLYGVKTLEREVKDLVKVDFTCENGQLCFFDVVKGKRSGEAAVKIAVDMVTNLPITPMTSESPSTSTATDIPGSAVAPRSSSAIISKKDALERIPLKDIPDGSDNCWLRSTYCQTIQNWADEVRTMQVLTDASTPQEAQQACSLNADGIGTLDIQNLITASSNKGTMLKFAEASSPENRLSALNILSNSLCTQISDILMHAPGTGLVSKMTEAIDPTQRIVVNTLLYDSICAKSFTLLPEFLVCQVRAVIEAVLAIQEETKKAFEMNLILPMLFTDHELDFIIPHIQEAVRQTCERYEDSIRAKISKTEMSDVESKEDAQSTGPPEFFPLERAQNLKCNIGTNISTIRAALRIDAIVAVTGISFVSFDIMSLTKGVFGFGPDDATNFMDPFVQKHILAANPFEVLDRNGVGALISTAIQKAKKVKALKVLATGPQVENATSLAYLQSIGVDAISVTTKALPICKIAAAQAAVAAKKKAASDSTWSFKNALQSLDTLYEDPELADMMILS